METWGCWLRSRLVLCSLMTAKTCVRAFKSQALFSRLSSFCKVDQMLLLMPWGSGLSNRWCRGKDLQLWRRSWILQEPETGEKNDQKWSKNGQTEINFFWHFRQLQISTWIGTDFWITEFGWVSWAVQKSLDHGLVPSWQRPRWCCRRDHKLIIYLAVLKVSTAVHGAGLKIFAFIKFECIALFIDLQRFWDYQSITESSRFHFHLHDRGLNMKPQEEERFKALTLLNAGHGTKFISEDLGLSRGLFSSSKSVQMRARDSNASLDQVKSSPSPMPPSWTLFWTGLLLIRQYRYVSMPGRWVWMSPQFAWRSRSLAGSPSWEENSRSSRRRQGKSSLTDWISSWPRWRKTGQQWEFSDKKIFMADQYHNCHNDRWIAIDRSDIKGISKTKHPRQVMVLCVIASDGKRMPPSSSIQRKDWIKKSVTQSWGTRSYHGWRSTTRRTTTCGSRTVLLPTLQPGCRNSVPTTLLTFGTPKLGQVQIAIPSTTSGGAWLRRSMLLFIQIWTHTISKEWMAYPETGIIDACKSFCKCIEAVIEANGLWIES